jgi:GNAT superfamily N-acetyltransferase
VALRPMTGATRDLEGALQLSRAAGWSFRLEDWRIAQLLGQGVLAEAGDQIIASALCWPYGDAFATYGHIIVAPAMQGRGLGRTLLTHLLDMTGDRAVMLNSTAEGFKLYRSYGFDTIGTVHQHMGLGSKGQIANLAQLDADPQIRAARAEDSLAMIEMDQRAFGAGRPRMIEEFLKIGAAAVIERGGDLQAYAICRPFGLGQVIGPVVATGVVDAKALIGHFLTANCGQTMRVDIGGETGLGPWLTELGLPEVGQVITMIRGQRPPMPGPERIFALASQSFG